MPLGAVGWGMVAAAAIGGGAAMASSSKQAHAANNATNLQGQINDKNQANLSPYMQQGVGANYRLSDLLGTSGNTGSEGYGSLTSQFTPQDYLNNRDPGYGFTLQQGQMALQNSQAADSGVLSGSALKGLIGYNQGMAATGYQNAYNRWFNNNNATYTRLSGLASLGENAAAGAGNVGVQAGANMANTMTGAANASAAGTVGAANAVTGSINNGLGYYMLNNMNNTPPPSVTSGSNWNGYNGTVNNPSAYVAGPG